MDMSGCVFGTVMPVLLPLYVRRMLAGMTCSSPPLPSPLVRVVEKDAQVEDQRQKYQANHENRIYSHNMHLYAPLH